MEKDYYSIKEILLGIRQSYINTQIKLELLKDCIAYSRLKYKDIYFSINNDEGSKFAVSCNINTRLSSNNIPRTNKILEEQGECIFQNKEKDIQIIDNDRFKSIIKSIMQDDFVNSSKYAAFVEKDADGNKIYINMIFDITGIYISPHLKPMIKYVPRFDEITVDNIYDEEKQIVSLDTKIPSINLSSYYCSLLRASNIKEKEIMILGHPKSNRNCEYEIEESKEKILLIKRY